ncbi:MAG TPA: choice-of-anchor D domain-containing protein [Terracidiphilus sp.]|nr:choice-of-anchor D domain-containing protein [Terracidiphilus sp.]
MGKRACVPLLIAALFLGVHSTGLLSQQGAKTTFPEQKPKSDADASQAAPTEAEEGEDDLDFAHKRNEWFVHLRAYPFAHIPAGARTAALRQHLALKQSTQHSLLARPASALRPRPEDAYTTLTWNFDGPSSISGGTGQTLYSGRATSLAINPTNPLVMYLGTAAGGIWGTTDGGTTWKPLTDTQASLAIGALTIDPNNPNTIYAGTGEADYSLDSYYGQGLLKSTDGGNTWTLISTPFTNGGPDAPQFAQIAIQPGNSSVLLAATEGGIFRSTDGGTTWKNEMGGYISAIIFDPSNANTAYAGLNGYFTSIVYGNSPAPVYKSTDGGVTWTGLTGGTTNPLPAGSQVYRTALSIDSSGNLLAGLAPSTAGSGTPYKSSDGGNTWTALTAPGDGIDWYRDWIVSVPGSPNILYTGGVNLFQSLDGGVTWTRSTESYAALLWADQHNAVFSPDGTKMYLMDDGGLFVTTSPATTNPTFTSLNNGIGSMTFYPGFGITSASPTGTIAGTQDHGTQIGTAGQTWSYSGGGNVCGDGGPVVLDADGGYAYAHCQGSPLSSWMSSATAGAPLGQPYPYGWVSAQSGINTSDRTAWVAPIATDPSNVTNVYTGTYRVYQSLNRGVLWTAISGDLTGGNATLNTIAVAPSNPNVVYAGAGDGTVSVTQNALAGASATWAKLTGLPNRGISKIVVAPDSAQDVYVVVGGFGSGHLYHSTDGGTTWSNLSGNLPDTPADSVAIDPSLLNTIYLATDTGVYVTSNGGTNWEVLGSNLPNVVVQDIQVVPATRLLRVITHGRGAWDLTLPLNGFVASTNLLSFGNQNVNTTSSAQTLTLNNNLISAVSITSISASAGYAETNTCGSSVASGATCTVSVTFAPTATGLANGTLTVMSGQGNISISLTGSGVAPAVTFSAPTVTFGNQLQGTSSSAQTVNLKNSGSSSLSSIALSITGANSGDFSQTSNCGSSLTAGSSCTISVVFKPGGVGTRTATLSVADNASGSPQTVALTGTGIAPAVSFSSASLTFASQPDGQASSAQTVTLKDTGTASLTGITISITGSNSSDFSQTSTCGSSLAAGANCTISVVFTPGATGSRSGTLSVADSASGSPQTLAITGTGEAPFTLSASTTSVSVAQGATANYSLNFAAATGFPTTLSVALSCSGLPAESSCTFTPSSIAVGTSSQTLSLAISTTAASSNARMAKSIARHRVPVLAAMLLAFWLVPRRRKAAWMAVILLLVLFEMGTAACGGGGGGGGGKGTGSGNSGTTIGNAMVTVTAKSTAYSTTQNLTLSVTQ